MPIECIRHGLAERFVTGDFETGSNISLRIDKLNRAIAVQGEKDKKNADQALKLLSSFKLKGDGRSSYTSSFLEWKQFLESDPDILCFEIESTTRVITGSGNGSVFEFGTQLLKPWGVPYISGTSLKGLVSSFLARNGGTFWKRFGGALKSSAQVELFGGMLENDSAKSSYQGSLRFLDARITPDSCGIGWYETDIINVHYQKYYAEQRMPDGTENPIPNKIAVLKPGLKFLAAVQGPNKYFEFVKDALGQALEKEGIGAKTAVGYGRFRILKSDAQKQKEIVEAIKKADIQTLNDLNKSYGKIGELRECFTNAINEFPLTQDLESLYLRFNPLKIILLKIENGSINNIDSFKKLKKTLGQSLKKFKLFLEEKWGSKLSSQHDGQKIFNHAMTEWNLDEQQIQDTWLIRELAFDWGDVLSDENAEDILESLETRSWPPPILLEEAIKKLNVSEKRKQELLELYEIVML